MMRIIFPRILLLTNPQVCRLRKAIASGSLANIKLSKTQLHKIEKSEGFLGSLFGPLLKHGLPLIGNVPKPLAKSVLISLGLTAAASAIDPPIHKNISRSDIKTLIIYNKEMNDIMKIFTLLEESGLLIKGVRETITN